MGGEDPTEAPSLQQSLQAEVCTKLPESSQKFRTSPKAQESQVTRVWWVFFFFFFWRTGELPQVRKDITATKRRVSTCSHSHHRGTDRAGQGHLPRCCHQSGKAVPFIPLQEGVMESFHYFRLAYHPHILPHLIQYYSQDYAQLTGVIRATPQQHHGA